MIGAGVDVLSMPAMWLSNLWFMMGLPPHGDAGFVVMMVFIVAIWAIYGLLLGLFLEWGLTKLKVADQGQHLCQTPSLIQRCCQHIKHHKVVFTTALILLVAVCGYCIVQKLELAKEREFYLKKIDHRAVAEAFYEIVTHPEKHLQPFGSDSGRDPKTDLDVPEVVRLLKPKHLWLRGEGPSESITLTKNDYTYLMLEHPFGKTGQYDLIYQEGPSSTDPRTILYTICNLPTKK